MVAHRELCPARSSYVRVCKLSLRVRCACEALFLRSQVLCLAVSLSAKFCIQSLPLTPLLRSWLSARPSLTHLQALLVRQAAEFLSDFLLLLLQQLSIGFFLQDLNLFTSAKTHKLLACIHSLCVRATEGREPGITSCLGRFF
jgi:hypothetical protein